MIVNNVGYNHRHDADFFIERPDGSGDWLFLILKTDALFTVGGKERVVRRGEVFLYPEGMPQFYKCLPKHEFANDWIHFSMETDDAEEFLKRNIPCGQGIRTDCAEYLSWCVKAIADEFASKSTFSRDSIRHYMWLIFNRVSDSLHHPDEQIFDSEHERLLTIRHKIYAEPYIPRSVTWAAHEVRMSASSFQYHYKNTFGVPFVQDFINAKIEYAKMLLTSTNLGVRDIAGKCGYQNYEHFARQFKERTGMTPLEYRRRPTPA